MVECTLALLADNAHVDASGKLYVLGEFRYLTALALPARHGQFSIVGRWEADPSELTAQNSLEMEIVDADGQKILPRFPKMPLVFGPIGESEPGKVEAKVIVAMQGLILPKYGHYVFQFFVNGRPAGTAKFFVTPSRVQTPDVPR